MTITESELRQHFPVLEHVNFFNHAGVSVISRPAAEALSRYAQEASHGEGLAGAWHQRLDAVRSLCARLIGADSPEEVAFVPNTSTGLSLVARGLRWQPGDQVVITDVEYPANRYPWQDLGRFGVEMVQVRQRPDRRIHVEDVIAAIGPHTRVVSLSHVQYASGHRIDLAPIAAAVHAGGGFLCVDAIQSLGAIPMDVRASGIDFLAADGHKWLLGPEGAGLFYCRAALLESLHPAVVGWLNMVEAMDFGNYRYEFAPTAQRFEPGSYNVPGLLAMGASIELLHSIGVEQVWSRLHELTSRLAAGLESRGWRLWSPRRDESETSGIVVFQPPAERDVDPKRLVSKLKGDGHIIVVREGRLRASPHFYNEPAQIDALLEALDTHSRQ